MNKTLKNLLINEAKELNWDIIVDCDKALHIRNTESDYMASIWIRDNYYYIDYLAQDDLINVSFAIPASAADPYKIFNYLRHYKIYINNLLRVREALCDIVSILVNINIPLKNTPDEVYMLQTQLVKSVFGLENTKHAGFEWGYVLI